MNFDDILFGETVSSLACGGVRSNVPNTPRYVEVGSERLAYYASCKFARTPAQARRQICDRRSQRSYAGFWVTRRSGGVVCRHFNDLDAVFKSDTCDDLRQLICAFQPPPGLRCGAEQLEHHQLGSR